MIRVFIDHATRGESLVISALTAGFSDQPHLNRTFLAVFGSPPTELLKNKNVKIHILAESFKNNFL